MNKVLVAFIGSIAIATVSAQQSGVATTIRARQVIDGRGGVTNNATVTVVNGKITSVGSASGAPTIDLGNLTLLPGFIDTHVHIGWHFADKGRQHSGPEPAEQAALYGAENAFVTLLAGFTTVQSVGAMSDKTLREAMKRGVRPGPRCQAAPSCRRWDRSRSRNGRPSRFARTSVA